MLLFVRSESRLSVLQVVFEALHSQEPRGYVVGWIIAISLLVGILIFLLLAVLLWKVNMFDLLQPPIIVPNPPNFQTCIHRCPLAWLVPISH